MFWFLVYRVAARLLRLLAGSSSHAVLEMENAVLRHQLAVLRRTVKRPDLRRSDRVFLAAVSRILPRGTVDLVPGLAGDAFSLASAAGQKEVDVSPPPSRATADRS